MLTNYGKGEYSIMKLATYFMIFIGIGVNFMGAYYVPSLEYRLDNKTSFSIWQLSSCVNHINKTRLGRDDIGLIFGKNSQEDIEILAMFTHAIGIVLVLVTAVLIWSILFKKRKIANISGRMILILEIILCIFIMVIVFYMNATINGIYEFENSIANLTIYGDIFVSPYLYGMTILALLASLFFWRIMNLEVETINQREKITGKELHKRIGKFTAFAMIFMMIAIAFSLILMGNRGFYFTIFAITILAMMPFFIAFEKRRNKGRQIMLIVALAILATLGRWMFFALPFVKPLIAMVIIGAASLGPLAGFMTGTLSGVMSNILFGQGPWTPWQMMALGLIGYLSGMVFYGKGHHLYEKQWFLALYGVFCGFLIYGFIMDTYSALSIISEISWETFLARYVSGMPVNLVHGIATGIFLIILGNPLYKKLSRVKLKYGIFLGEEQEF